MDSLKERLRRRIHFLSRPELTSEQAEAARLQLLPRKTPAKSSLIGPVIYMPDALSFLGMREEIFQRAIYKFPAASSAPRILDCGANIGLSVIYFKRLYRQARITAFEPDPGILGYLHRNLASAGIDDVEVIPKGVWSSEGVLRFFSEGADGGRISVTETEANGEIPTVRLRDYLTEPVDFLKIDIEGAETEVLRDCADRLRSVRYLFVEHHSFAGRSQTLPEVLAILARAGFRCHAQTLGASPQPFMEIKTDLEMEQQMNIFAYRPAEI